MNVLRTKTTTLTTPAIVGVNFKSEKDKYTDIIARILPTIHNDTTPIP